MDASNRGSGTVMGAGSVVVVVDRATVVVVDVVVVVSSTTAEVTGGRYRGRVVVGAGARVVVVVGTPMESAIARVAALIPVVRATYPDGSIS